jgi:hypothetical protein
VACGSLARLLVLIEAILEQDDDGNITSDPKDEDNDQFIPELIERDNGEPSDAEAIRSLPTARDFSPLGVTAGSL